MSTRWDARRKGRAHGLLAADVGLGTKLSARLKLGKIAGGTPSVFIDWKGRLLAMGRAEAKVRGLPWNRVGGWKRTVRRTGTLRADALRRLKRALMGSG